MWTIPTDIVQRLAIDRQAGMALVDENGDEIASVTSIGTATISARGHHDVVHGAAAQLEDIEEQNPLLGGDRFCRFLDLASFDEFLDRFDERGIAAPAPQSPKPVLEHAKWRLLVLIVALVLAGSLIACPSGEAAGRRRKDLAIPRPASTLTSSSSIRRAPAGFS